MRPITILIGLALIVLGVAAYIISGMASFTALIPSFFGLPILVLGVLAGRQRLRMHVMHGVALLALIGMAGGAMGLPGLIDMASGEEVERPSAVVVQSLMFLLCFVLLVACVRSFIAARRGEKQRFEKPE